MATTSIDPDGGNCGTDETQWPTGWLAQKVKANEERLIRAENLIELLMRRTEKLHHRTMDLEGEEIT